MNQNIKKAIPTHRVREFLTVEQQNKAKVMGKVYTGYSPYYGSELGAIGTEEYVKNSKQFDEQVMANRQRNKYL